MASSYFFFDMIVTGWLIIYLFKWNYFFSTFEKNLIAVDRNITYNALFISHNATFCDHHENMPI